VATTKDPALAALGLAELELLAQLASSKQAAVSATDTIGKYLLRVLECM
jgi:hypothetical protein